MKGVLLIPSTGAGAQLTTMPGADGAFEFREVPPGV